MRIALLYFAWVRERIGLAGEQPDVPDSIGTVAALLDWLAGQSDGHAQALADRDAIRVAVNQAHVSMNAPVRPGDEVAIFPPVTGG